ncbi:acylneuraminate cytidylyltransferase family protein [Shewanella algae]|uniref:acylneuraminate cytidylyltransferase family protein n=1 Tax=Shewanella algae TaxID=38313 RepID=UPI0034D60615
MTDKNSQFTLAVIPARGGSKGIPKKNIKSLGGKPLILYTIEQALEATSIDKIVVSTDCDEIASVCKEYSSVEVIMRPEELASDTAKTEQALIHACDFLEENYAISVDVVVTLEPTSPFRTSSSIDKCMSTFSRGDGDAVVTVVEFTDVLGRIVEDRYVHLIPNQPRRRQEREVLYKESSTIYCTSVISLRKYNSVLGNASIPVVISAEESFDINEPLDFDLAEALVNIRRKS